MKLYEYVLTDTKGISKAEATLRAMRTAKEAAQTFGWKISQVTLIEGESLPNNETRYTFHIHGEEINER